MAKGLDQKFLHYGIRKEDLDLISTLCDKYGIDFDWMSEEILRKFHEWRICNLLTTFYLPPTITATIDTNKDALFYKTGCDLFHCAF